MLPKGKSKMPNPSSHHYHSSSKVSGLLRCVVVIWVLEVTLGVLAVKLIALDTLYHHQHCFLTVVLDLVAVGSGLGEFAVERLAEDSRGASQKLLVNQLDLTVTGQHDSVGNLILVGRSFVRSRG